VEEGEEEKDEGMMEGGEGGWGGGVSHKKAEKDDVTYERESCGSFVRK
jgi:hypothetical protein